jgi:hypothetical protein
VAFAVSEIDLVVSRFIGVLLFCPDSPAISEGEHGVCRLQRWAAGAEKSFGTT